MNSPDTIQAAIEKLSDQREAAALGPWVNLPGESQVTNDNGWVIGDATLSETAELVATLHATIDAQLALLGQALAWHREWDSDPKAPGRDFDERVYLLARAILGEDADA